MNKDFTQKDENGGESRKRMNTESQGSRLSKRSQLIMETVPNEEEC